MKEETKTLTLQLNGEIGAIDEEGIASDLGVSCTLKGSTANIIQMIAATMNESDALRTIILMSADIYVKKKQLEKVETVEDMHNLANSIITSELSEKSRNSIIEKAAKETLDKCDDMPSDLKELFKALIPNQNDE